MRQRSFVFISGFLLLIIGSIIYSNALQGAFQFDDSITIVRNSSIRNFRNIPALFESFNTRFLVGLSFALNYAIGKLEPLGYHLFNLLIHLLNAANVFCLVLLTFKTPFFK